MPNYYKTTNPEQYEALTAAIKANPDVLQINWQNLYNVNRNDYTTISNAYGYDQPVSGLQSRYILGDRDIYTKHFMSNINYTSRVGDIVTITAGANYAWQNNHYYQQVEDLLGGDFWLNVNQYAERDFHNDNNKIQYDLDKPNRLVGKNGHYGYDYDLTYSKAAAWWQTKINLDHFDFFWASEISTTQFFRTGNVRMGLFPDSSYGKSRKQNFVNSSNKIGITYKLNGRNYFYINAAYLTTAPSAENAYVSPRTRSSVQSDIKSETIETLEGGYNLNTPFIRLHIGGYLTKSQHGMDVINFFDDSSNAFGNYSLSGIDRLYFGGEFGTEIKLTQTLTLNAAASVGRAYYDSRQQETLTIDNTGDVASSQTVYMKNYRIPSTPQNVYSLGLRYNSPKYWFVGLTGSYMNNDWLSVDPARHVASAVANIDPTTDAAAIHSFLQQEKLDGAFTLDLFAGWNKRLRHVYIDKKPVNLVFTLGVNNLANNKNIRSGGYEQLRSSDYFVTDFNNGYERFPPKYFYALGLNYNISVALRF
ncbi:MAG: hypothetical protein PW786_09095 [Arachidicoccus sp.]|nr:hypothetical protein [Arachidicoccus sp.]